MKKHLVVSFSKVLLNITLIMLGLSILWFITIGLPFRFNINTCIGLILSLVYLLIVYDLRKIVYSTNSTPFCLDNVKRFKRIGYYMILIAVIDGVINWKKESNFEFIGTQSGSLKGSFVMCIILACIALVLSEIFKQAVELKNDNDITV
ncbi:hypothetical protein CDLVIII_2969 [Clostridium sp. DL-VIII]|uniref:DUF2975 domain-containing protein n=1 Tax=Clostridium sp. DL-VIII TaxID=641107 RepID=UPI00023AFCD8|nr:DUF2975 domain-containing protein [Clostridium sp. DL-VIII]EHI99559.1 hypothetical protein CDLVIII_2969 [Clostridium sp. DL-VIII]